MELLEISFGIRSNLHRSPVLGSSTTLADRLSLIALSDGLNPRVCPFCAGTDPLERDGKRQGGILENA
jgi:hypothetical protein